MTNGERLRIEISNMTDEEIANYIFNAPIACRECPLVRIDGFDQAKCLEMKYKISNIDHIAEEKYCHKKVLKWLKQEELMYNDTPVRSVYKTNYERIREMNEEELAEFINNSLPNGICEFGCIAKEFCDTPQARGMTCKEVITKWLKQEAKL